MVCIFGQNNVIQWVHSFLHIATTMSQIHQRSGILWRCVKGHRDVQNAARAAEKNATSVYMLKPSLFKDHNCWAEI